ncbi:MATE family efflux transporter [Dysgonomonas sp. 25]|uniref:MATE family efflux transporter n=1 Tax=Dysgonomonas sp. 25 TaxID=2302933 RepID=UPI00210708F4|nr:MATE family efflux transporter [Dysgonomonas sp. 25]
MADKLLYSYRDIWKVSIPIMLGLLAQTIVQLTDTYFLGHVGKVAQSAVGLAGVYYIVCFTICFGFSIGAQIMISRRNGEGNHHKIGTIVIQGLAFLLLIALVLFIVSRLVTTNLLAGYLSSEGFYEAFDDYLSWRVFGFFFASMNVMFRAFYVGIARTPVLTLNAVIMGLVNCFFDYVLIFGHWGFPALGVPGAAIASVLSEIASVLFFFIYTFVTVDLKKYGFARMRFQFAIVKSILKISTFTMIQYLISMSTWFIFFIAVYQQSPDALAITNIVRNFYMVFFIPMNAFATTANTLVGNTMGAGRTHEVVPLIKRIGLSSLSMIAVIMATTIIGSEFWISLIAPLDDVALIPQTVAPLMVVVAILPVCSISTVVFNAISGTGNTKAALKLEIATLVLYVLYMYWIVIYKQAPLTICWTVEAVYWGGLLTSSLLYLRYAKWQQKRV